MKRIILNLKKGSFLLFIACVSTFPSLSADDIAIASEYEKNGQISEARDLYISWLKGDVNHDNPSYGRTLLHVLRMGGSTDDLLQLIDSYLPGVTNFHDKREILKFGAYVADLSGKNGKARVYFSRLHEMKNTPYDWIISYYDMQKGEDIPPEDPLTTAIHSNNELYVKNKALVYLVYLNRTAEGIRSVINWQEQAEGRFPFLRNYPEWLLFNWYFYSVADKQDKAGEYKSALQKDFSNTPEAAIVDGRISLLSNPALLFSGGGTSAVLPVVPTPPIKVYSYLQTGAFSNRENAISLQQEIERKTGFSPSILKSGGIFKVVIKTMDPERVQKLLGQEGFEAFRIPQPAQNR